MIEIEDQNPASPLQLYVDTLLLDLFYGPDRTVTLHRTGALPRPKNYLGDLGFDFNHSTITYDRVVNRLKVMCDLNPMPYRQPCAGSIEMTLADKGVIKGLTFSVIFDDTASQPYVRLKLPDGA